MSSSCYNALRTSGLITLPSERTLRDYTYWIKSEIGFSEAVDIQPIKEANISKEKDRYIILIIIMGLTKDSFLKYLQDWEDSVKGRTDFTSDQNSTQTLEGIKLTGDLITRHYILVCL